LSREEDAVTVNVTGVTLFNEFVLRPIIQLLPEQQHELVSLLADGKIKKGQIKKSSDAATRTW
jgi:hypothetical protein